METKKAFVRTLERLEGYVKRMDVDLQNARYLHDTDNMAWAYKAAMDIENMAERIVLLSRALPIYTGNPVAAQDVGNCIAANIPVEIGFTAESWFCVRIPLLLPKKAEGSASYVRSFLYPAMQQFFRNKPPVRYSNCVLIYRHVYDKDRSERQRRDHDNIEINMVSDTVALYVMEDDAPVTCQHYYCSAAGTTEQTEVYVVPVKEFHLWLVTETRFPDKGVKLYENIPELPQKEV